MTAWSEQEKVKRQLALKYGKGVRVEDHGTYKRAGLKREGKFVWGVGDTWELAVADLERKLEKLGQ